MGEVFRARDTRLGRDVAIKVLPEAFAQDPERRARFEREARAVAALSHPHIVALHDVGEEEGVAYAVTELLEGETLRSALRRGPLPVRKAVELAVQIARGLAAAHEKGLVHRDLKPENVFVTAEGPAKVLDFGLARQEAATASGESALATLTRDTAAGVVVGTVGYMSPEQVQGVAVDHRADIFALGCVVHEMLTGRRAFERPTAAETMTAILKEDAPALSGTGRPISAVLERTVHRCLEKNPAERFQAARDVAFALEALSGESGTTVAVAAPSARRRRLLSWGAAALPAVAAGALGYVAGRRRGLQAVPRPTFRRLTFRRGPIVTARFGPDGKTVFYGAPWEGRPYRVYQTRPGESELPLPIENADLLSVARDGQMALLLVRQTGFNAWWKKGTLAVVRAAGGAPRELAEEVWAADFAPDGRSLAVVREVAGARRLEYPLGHVLYEADDFLWYLRVSPDGERVAFFDHSRAGVLSVAVVDRSGRRSVLVEPLDDWFDLTWSADGREVWFAAVRPCAGTAGTLHAVALDGRQRVLFEAPGAFDIHDLAPDGTALVAQLQNRSGMRRWARSGEAEEDLSWQDISFPLDLTPDGRTLLFVAVTEGGGGDRASAATYVRRLDGTSAVPAGDRPANALSPDGRVVLTVLANEVRLDPVGAGEPRVVPTGLPRVVAARWLRDGRGVLLLAKEEKGTARFHLLDLKSGTPASVRPASVPFACNTLGLMVTFTASPDGRRSALAGADGRIQIVPLDGGEPRPLPGSEANEQPVQWSPDGRLLYCLRRGRMPASVFEIDVASGSRRLWTTIQPPSLAATDIFLVLAADLRTGVYGYPDFSADLYLVDGLR
jgi:hypothetical protein